MNTHLQDNIMKGILANEQRRKARKRKEKTIMVVYTGAIFFALLFLLFVTRPQSVSLKLRLPGLAEFETARQELMVYFRMFILILILSLMAFGVYFVKPRRSQGGVES